MYKYIYIYTVYTCDDMWKHQNPIVHHQTPGPKVRFTSFSSSFLPFDLASWQPWHKKNVRPWKLHVGNWRIIMFN